MSWYTGYDTSIRPKFNVGEKAKIISLGPMYTTYEGWFGKNGVKELEESYAYNKVPTLFSIAEVVAVGDHVYNRTIIYAIKINEKIYLAIS